jgi:hypothetical protein
LQEDETAPNPRNETSESIQDVRGTKRKLSVACTRSNLVVEGEERRGDEFAAPNNGNDNTELPIPGSCSNFAHVRRSANGAPSENMAAEETSVQHETELVGSTKCKERKYK